MAPSSPSPDSRIPFGARVRAALVPFLEAYVGARASSLVEAEIAECGEPDNLVAALALGHALLVEIEEEEARARAREELDVLLGNIKATSLVPPPVS